MNKKARAAAEYVKKHGRYGDTELLHVNKAELKILEQVTGIPLTINPDTGEPEAFLQFLLPLVGSTLAPTLFGTAVAPWMAAAIGSAAGSALAGGNMTDVLTSAVTGGLGGIGGGATSAADDAFAAVAGGTPEALAGGLAQAPTFLDKVGSAFGTLGDRATDIISDPFAKGNIVPAFMGLSAIGDMMTPKAETGDDYNPDDHPMERLPESDMRINRYVGAPAGYRPGIDPEHNFFPGFKGFADGGIIPATNNNLFQSFLSDPLQFGLIGILPKVMDALTGTKPGEINEKSSMDSTEEDRKRAMQGYTGFQPMPGNQMGARRFAKGGSVQVRNTENQNPQGSYGYTNAGSNISTNNPRGVPNNIVSLFSRLHADRNANNGGGATTTPPRNITVNAPDLSAWVPNMPGIVERAGFTPQQTASWRSDVPPSSGPIRIMPITPPTQAPGGAPVTPPVTAPNNPYPQLNPRQTGNLERLLRKYNKKEDTNYNLTNYRDAPFYARKLQERGFAEGGMVDPGLQEQSDQIVGAAIEVIKAQDQSPEGKAIIQQFVQMFGPEAFKALIAKVMSGGGDGGEGGEGGGTIPGEGGGMEDDVPAVIDGKEPAALSSGEYVIPADVVAHLGDGNGAGGKGSKVLDDMIRRIRQEKTGSAQQPAPLDINKVLPI